MGLLRQFVKTSIETLLPREVFLTRGRSRHISLTFDDGPHPEFTPRVLDALTASNLRATFFVIGQLAEQHPQLVRRMVDEGHEVGNHTWTHSEPQSTSTDVFLKEIRRTDELLHDLTGQECRQVRPPKGELSLGKLWGLLGMRRTIVLWNQDTKDYLMKSSAEMHTWCDSYRPHEGDIVLLHDNRPFAASAAEWFCNNSLASFSVVSQQLARVRETTVK